MPIGRRRSERPNPLYALGELQITGITTASAVSIVNSIPPGASEAWIQCTGGNVRWTCDPDTPPTPTSGMVMIPMDTATPPGLPIDVLKLSDMQLALQNLRFIAISTTAKVDCQFWQRA